MSVLHEVCRVYADKMNRYESVAGLAMLWERYAREVGIERADLHGAKITGELYLLCLYSRSYYKL